MDPDKLMEAPEVDGDREGAYLGRRWPYHLISRLVIFSVREIVIKSILSGQPQLQKAFHEQVATNIYCYLYSRKLRTNPDKKL